MLEKNSLYQIQPLSLTIMDNISKKEIELKQDEIVKVLDFKGINVKIERLDTKEIFEVSKQGLSFSVEKI
ncbi:MAG: hypothetical protein ACLVH8_11570 [Fusobacterium sp.]